MCLKGRGLYRLYLDRVCCYDALERRIGAFLLIILRENSQSLSSVLHILLEKCLTEEGEARNVLNKSSGQADW